MHIHVHIQLVHIRAHYCVPDTHTAKHSTSSGLSHVRGHPDPHSRYTLSPGQRGLGPGPISIDGGGRSSVSCGGGGGGCIIGGGGGGGIGGGSMGRGGGRGAGGRGRTQMYLYSFRHIINYTYKCI